MICVWTFPFFICIFFSHYSYLSLCSWADYWVGRALQFLIKLFFFILFPFLLFTTKSFLWKYNWISICIFSLWQVTFFFNISRFGYTIYWFHFPYKRHNFLSENRISVHRILLSFFPLKYLLLYFFENSQLSMYSLSS